MGRWKKIEKKLMRYIVMEKTHEYKGYVGTIEFSEPDNCYWGKVIGINNGILYEGDDIEALLKDFEEAIDFYLIGMSEEELEKDRREMQEYALLHA